MFREHFGHSSVLGGIWVIFEVYGVFLSTYRFKGHFCHFIGLGYFGQFLGFEDILVILRFRGYFGHI